MKKQEPTELKTRVALVRKIDHNIIENIVLEGCTVNVDDIHELKKANTQLLGDIPYGILVNPELMTDITKEARKLSASKSFAKKTVAKAFLVKSLGHKLVGQFYIKVNRPHIKTNIFTERDQAINWLKEQLDNELNRHTEKKK